MAARVWLNVLVGIFVIFFVWVLTEPLFGFIYEMALGMGVDASYLTFIYQVHDLFPIFVVIGLMLWGFVNAQRREPDEWR